MLLEKLLSILIVLGCAFVGVVATGVMLFFQIAYCKFLCKLIGGACYGKESEKGDKDAEI